MKKQKNKEADLWVRQIVFELKNEYQEFIYPISMLKFEEDKDDMLQEGFATDGMTVYYHPQYILEHRRSILKTQLIHILLHGLLGHFEVKDEYSNKLYRDFMMDMQVEYVLMKTKNGDVQKSNYFRNKLDEFVQGDYSMSIYRRLCDEIIPTRNIEYYYRLLQTDKHEVWDRESKEKNRKTCIRLWSSVQENMLGEKKGNIWIEDAMNYLADTMAEGECPDKENVYQIGQGKGINYRELLKSFVHIKEKETPDSIDLMLYQYGLELYGDVPLIEPTEELVCDEVNRIAIAVDVSGSCENDEQMKYFWGETYECLCYLKENNKDTEVILIQCDEVIQREQIINLREWYEIPTEVSVQGGGGTSFIPVFDRLMQMEKAGKKIDALLYLTDGNGAYPEKQPDYPVYFILDDNDEGAWLIPKWINIINLH